MSDLKIAPEPDTSVIPALLVAAVILVIALGAFYYLYPHTIADLKVVKTDAFAPHTELGTLQTGRSHGLKVIGPDTTTGEDDLYVITTVNMTDRVRVPLLLSGATAHVVFADGSQFDSEMIPAGDVKRLQTIFPKIEPLIGNPIPEIAQFDPNQTRTGTFVFGFPGRNAQAWQQKRQASITLEFQNESPQTAPLP